MNRGFARFIGDVFDLFADNGLNTLCQRMLFSIAVLIVFFRLLYLKIE